MFIIVRHATEIALKSEIVRQKFIDRLHENMKAAFARHRMALEIQATGSRFFLVTEDEKVLDVLPRIFGISSFSVIEHVSRPNMDSMKETVAAYAPLVAGRSFCVRAKRFRVRGLNSPEVERTLGAVLFPYAKKVDLTRPEIRVQVEIRKDNAYFYSGSHPGAGGLPLGIEGRGLCLISGGFDSAVAAWMIMKRGVALDFIFFNLAGDDYLRSTLQVAKHLADHWSFGYAPRFFVCEFGPVAEEISRRVDPRYPQVILKRAMYRTASRLAETIPSMQALVTGESIGQVSSQTLHNLAAIDPASDHMVLRPLVGLDKEEIIRLSHKIGTGILSAQIKEYCQISKHKPITRATPAKAAHQESLLDPNIYVRVLDGRKVIDLDGLDGESLGMNDFYIDSIAAEDVVIDCRSSFQYNHWHYPDALNLAPEDLLQMLGSMDKQRRYILYCPYGTQTALVAQKMREAGFHAHSFRGGTRAVKHWCERTTPTTSEGT